MSERITKKRLERSLENLNHVFGENPAPYTKTDEGLRANAGTFVLDIAYGGYAVDRMHKSGGVSNVIGRGTARETWEQIQAYMAGARMMESTLKPEYTVWAMVREQGAQGVFEERILFVRVDKEEEPDLENALVTAINKQGFEVQCLNKYYKR